MVAYSSASRIELRLPAGVDNTSTVEITIQIRDILNAITEYNLGSVIVVSDTAEIDNLFSALSQPNTGSLNTNPTVQLLSSGNPNVVGQVISAVSQILNDINTEQLQSVASRSYFILTYFCWCSAPLSLTNY